MGWDVFITIYLYIYLYIYIFIFIREKRLLNKPIWSSWDFNEKIAFNLDWSNQSKPQQDLRIFHLNNPEMIGIHQIVSFIIENTNFCWHILHNRLSVFF